jgi:hypothetical protein
VDVSLDSAGLSVESGLEDEFGELGSGYSVSFDLMDVKGEAYLEPWRE